jgi:D-sedoheptulose 7-phosphate isomerase
MQIVNKKNYKELTTRAFNEHARVIRETFINLEENIKKAADMIAKSLVSEGTIFWCGNGGSAADSQHIAAEFIGRFKKDRQPLRSIALTTDTSILTCISNDYSYEKIFSRQLNALGRKGDVMVVITTSGKSENIKQVLIQAQKMGIKTIGLLGKKGGKCKKYVDIPIIVPSDTTARIQEAHILIEHLLCELVENKLGLD